MKSMIKLFTTVLVMFTLSKGVAADPKPIKVETNKELQNLLRNPAFDLDDTALSARVHFLINSEGEIVVIDVKGGNYIIEDYVKYRLNYKKLKSKELAPLQEYTFEVHFKTGK
ncbi:hypothetical protein [Robertkochia solimangrovi]|uniref:hypothetical protein n=1 Tax=Robertkochia solimangrovi TaxID=2213046 RepID=UPI00117DF0EE|nr:hypothetical protein [Robertkochia solimangrovi]TRZ42775.1 hypothetical protein DMZ48_11935 [Robertkochia solimangrovi]